MPSPDADSSLCRLQAGMYPAARTWESGLKARLSTVVVRFKKLFSGFLKPGIAGAAPADASAVARPGLLALAPPVSR